MKHINNLIKYMKNKKKRRKYHELNELYFEQYDYLIEGNFY
jgi:hypothetical protein